MDSSISQPNPINNHCHKASTATNNNDDYQVADHDLTNMIGRDLNFMKETMTQIQKFLKTREGGSDTNELDQLKMSVKKLKSQIPSKLKIHYDDDSKPHRKPWFDGSINSRSGNYQVDVNKASNLHSLYNQPEFDHTTALEDFRKRIMIYWWIGRHTEEEIVLGKAAEDAEDFVNEILDELTAKGFIEPLPTLYTPDAAIIDGRHEFIFKSGTDVKIVYLGRWKNSVTHHIEVPDIKILNALKNMKQLRFLSLQGISFITELSQFISQLTDLKILDLKACHNLEVIPNWIGLLENLTHLNISECYLLDHMPKGLGALSNLQVLKGFIIGDSKDKKSSQLFSKQTTLIRSFEQDDPKLPLSLELPSSLQKLELECFPEIDTPGWLWSGNLKNLKKLYIRGGLLCDLDKIIATAVEMLQLKYLSNLEMPWKDIMMLFPNLIYLEKVEYPGLNSFPCDQNGVRMKKDNGIDEKYGGRSC
ncbi:unnamed protein product [Camellia sinensis]